MTGAAPVILALLIGDSNLAAPGGYGDQLMDMSPEIVATGCPGSSMDEWLPRSPDAKYGCNGSSEVGNLYTAHLEPWLPVDQVVVALGSADAIELQDAAELEAEADELVDELLAAGIREVVLISPPRCYPATEPSYFPCTPERSAALVEYGRALRDLCGGAVVCGPDFHSLLNRREHFGPDGSHFSDLGHAVAFDAMIEALPEPSGLGWTSTVVLALLARGKKLSIASRISSNATH